MNCADDYNAIFYLLNNLVDSIVFVFFGFYLVFFFDHSLVYSFIILLFMYLLFRGPQVY